MTGLLGPSVPRLPDLRQRRPARPSRVNDVVYEVKRSRTSGAHITVERTGPGSWVEQEPGWMTICVTHSACVMHATRSLAIAWAGDPAEWCSACREAADRPVPVPDADPLVTAIYETLDSLIVDAHGIPESEQMAWAFRIAARLVRDKLVA